MTGLDRRGVGTIRTGGRSARVHATVLAATVNELLQHGYSGLRIPRIAETAGVHKTTVYRRWPTRAGLVTEALAAQARGAIPVPNNGNARDDLLQLARSVTRQIRSPMGGGLVRVLLSESDRHPEIRAVANQFWSSRFELAGTVVSRAVARGELPSSTNPDLLLEALAGPLFMRTFLLFAPINDVYLHRHVEHLLVAFGWRPIPKKASKQSGSRN